MAYKVTVIGAGSVGATIAYTLMVRGVASEIVMIDINEEKALGEALDIRQGAPLCNAVNIYAGTYSDAKDSDVVVLTSGVARKPGQSRLDLTQTNVNITKKIIPEVTRYAPNAIYIVVANPVDILTYQFYKTAGLPANQIFGSGTTLDSARLRARVAEYYKIAQQNVHAYVFGEHGDSSFVPWSLANIASIKVDEYRNTIEDHDQIIPTLVHSEVEDYIRKSGGKIIQRKGATFYAIAISVAHIIDCIKGALDTTLTVSSMLGGEYGISDVCLSILTVVGRDGVKSRINAPLTDDEVDKLKHSADCLKDIIKQLTF